VTLSRAYSSFTSSLLQVRPGISQPKPPQNELGFGKYFTDHMLNIHWTKNDGWAQPQIQPMEPLQIHPAAKVLHYAQELYEGMKAYRGADGKIRVFRPMHNMARLNISAERSCLPQVDGKQLMQCIQRLIECDRDWVPHSQSSSLYIRVSMMGTEPTLGVGASNQVQLFVILSPVGPYFANGLKPVNLLADPQYVRAWPGGCGYVKMGSNYAPTLWTQEMAEKSGCHQCLWLVGDDEEITEVGAMNLFILMRNKSTGRLELVTPPLTNGCILPGVTRQSILEMTVEWDDQLDVIERKITMGEVLEANREGRIIEIFGSGTAVVVCPVGNIKYKSEMVPVPVDQSENSLSKRITRRLNDIYYGKIDHPWAVEIGSQIELSQQEEQRLTTYTNSILQHIR